MCHHFCFSPLKFKNPQRIQDKNHQPRDGVSQQTVGFFRLPQVPEQVLDLEVADVSTASMGTGICYLHLVDFYGIFYLRGWLIFMVNVGKYTIITWMLWGLVNSHSPLGNSWFFQPRKQTWSTWKWWFWKRRFLLGFPSFSGSMLVFRGVPLRWWVLNCYINLWDCMVLKQLIWIWDMSVFQLLEAGVSSIESRPMNLPNFRWNCHHPTDTTIEVKLE